MIFPALPSGTRSETTPPPAVFQAQCRALTCRDACDLITAAYPELSHSWAKRNLARLMQMTPANFAVYLSNAVQIVENAPLIAAVAERHQVSRDLAIELIASADLAGRIARADVRRVALHPALHDDTAVTAVARLDLEAVSA